MKLFSARTLGLLLRMPYEFRFESLDAAPQVISRIRSIAPRVPWLSGLLWSMSFDDLPEGVRFHIDIDFRVIDRRYFRPRVYFFRWFDVDGMIYPPDARTLTVVVGVIRCSRHAVGRIAVNALFIVVWVFLLLYVTGMNLHTIYGWTLLTLIFMLDISWLRLLRYRRKLWRKLAKALP